MSASSQPSCGSANADRSDSAAYSTGHSARPSASAGDSAVAEALVAAATELRDAVDSLSFGEPVTHVYNPLSYAFAMHAAYLRTFARGPREVVFFGMNPGPWGMAQTGVPFGEVAAVRDWLRLNEPIGAPAEQHPKRPVEGLACGRSEVSGRRLWGAFRDRFHTAERFFASHFVANYCPLLFMESGGRNRTPDKLTRPERDALTAACDRHAAAVLRILQPRIVLGVGRYACRQLERVVERHAADQATGRAAAAQPAGRDAAGNEAAEPPFPVSCPQVAEILHPSPANPRANQGWKAELEARMRELGVW